MAPLSSPLAPTPQPPTPDSHVDTNVARAPHHGASSSHQQREKGTSALPTSQAKKGEGEKEKGKEHTLLHQATIRHSFSPNSPSHAQSATPTTNTSATTTSTKPPPPPSSSPSNPSAPILVTPFPPPSSTASDSMRLKPSPPKPDPLLSPPPDPSSFSFPTLLSSLGPDADESITRIAEICGKSKMSLADEHGSHLPPLGVVERGDGGMGVENRVHAERADGEVEARDGGVGGSDGRAVRGGERRAEGGGERVGEKERGGIWGSVVGWLRGSRERREASGAGKSLRGALDAERVEARV